MSIPKRQQIREAFKAMLLNNTAAGENVYSNRVSAFWRSELPSVSIFMRDEEASPRDMSARSYLRKATLSVEIHAEAKEDLDALLDQIADQVEAIVINDSSLSGTVQGCVLQGTEIELAGEATTPIGVLSLSYQILYQK